MSLQSLFVVTCVIWSLPYLHHLCLVFIILCLSSKPTWNRVRKFTPAIRSSKLFANDEAEAVVWMTRLGDGLGVKFEWISS